MINAKYVIGGLLFIILLLAKTYVDTLHDQRLIDKVNSVKCAPDNRSTTS